MGSRRGGGGFPLEEKEFGILESIRSGRRFIDLDFAERNEHGS